MATFDNLAALPASVLTTRLGRLVTGGQQQLGQDPDVLADC